MEAESNELQVGELLYEAEVQFTEVVEYGVGLEAFLAGEVDLPAAGARFDVHFQGSLGGGRLSGEVQGIDYLHVRADGRVELHIHARITAEDGEVIAFFADGVASPRPDTPVMELRENVGFSTASPTWAWLNQVQGWATGTVDPTTGEVRVKAFVA